MPQDLEQKAKTKSAYRYEIGDFTAFTGVGKYAGRNRHLNIKSNEYLEYTKRHFRLILFNVAMMNLVVLPVAYQLTELVK